MNSQINKFEEQIDKFIAKRSNLKLLTAVLLGVLVIAIVLCFMRKYRLAMLLLSLVVGAVVIWVFRLTDALIDAGDILKALFKAFA